MYGILYAMENVYLTSPSAFWSASASDKVALILDGYLFVQVGEDKVALILDGYLFVQVGALRYCRTALHCRRLLLCRCADALLRCCSHVLLPFCVAVPLYGCTASTAVLLYCI